MRLDELGCEMVWDGMDRIESCMEGGMKGWAAYMVRQVRQHIWMGLMDGWLDRLMDGWMEDGSDEWVDGLME